MTGGTARLQPLDGLIADITTTRGTGSEEPRGPQNADDTVECELLDEADQEGDNKKNQRI